MRMTTVCVAPASAMLLCFVAYGGQAGGAGRDYRARVEQWRADHEAAYVRDYVPLAGLFFLGPGVNAAGSGPDSVVRLPDRAPSSVGVFVYDAGRVHFDPSPGASVAFNGQPLRSRVELKSDMEESPDELAVGDIDLWVHMSGARHTIRMRDPQGEGARNFAGFRWFPIDERYQVVGRLLRDPAPREVQVASLTGDPQTYLTEGIVEFTLDGQVLTMRPMTSSPGRFFFIFRDTTSGTETYEAARFLYADLQPDDTTVLDFNQAYNPPCAFNPYTTCPLPPPENRLRIAVRAGELDYVNPETAGSRFNP